MFCVALTVPGVDPLKYAARIWAAVWPAWARPFAPYWFRPTPCPQPRPWNVTLVPSVVADVGHVIFGQVPIGIGVASARATAAGVAVGDADDDGLGEADGLAEGDAEGDGEAPAEAAAGRRRLRGCGDGRVGAPARLGVDRGDGHGHGRGDEHGEQGAESGARDGWRPAPCTAGWLVAWEDRRRSGVAGPWPWGTRTGAAVVPGKGPVRYGAVDDADLPRPRRLRHRGDDATLGRRPARPRVRRPRRRAAQAEGGGRGRGLRGAGPR